MMVVGWQRCAAGCVSPRGPRGWFWPRLEPGFGIFRVDACVGRYLDKVPSMYMELLVDVLRFRCMPGKHCPLWVERPPWISLADLTSPRAGFNASRALPLRSRRRYDGFSVLQVPGFGLATKPLPKEVLLASTAPTVSTDLGGPRSNRHARLKNHGPRRS